MVEIDCVPQMPKKKGSSWYFKIRPSKIHEGIIEPGKLYRVVAVEEKD